MSKQHDIRWEQRFYNYVKAFNKFEEAVNYIKQNYSDGHTFATNALNNGMRIEYVSKLLDHSSIR